MGLKPAESVAGVPSAATQSMGLWVQAGSYSIPPGRNPSLSKRCGAAFAHRLYPRLTSYRSSMLHTRAWRVTNSHHSAQHTMSRALLMVSTQWAGLEKYLLKFLGVSDICGV
jgi:hypothetical protein